MSKFFFDWGIAAYQTNFDVTLKVSNDVSIPKKTTGKFSPLNMPFDFVWQN